MSIIRRKKQDNFTTIDNRPFRNRQLSFEARGVLIHLLTNRDDWEVRTENLQHESPNAGRDRILRILRELQTAGHLHRHKERLPDGTWEWQLVIYEHPDLNPYFKPEDPETASQAMDEAEKPAKAQKPEAAFQVMAEDPEAASPEADNPTPVKPTPDDPAILRSTKGTKTKGDEKLTEEEPKTMADEAVKIRERELRKEICSLKGRRKVAAIKDEEWAAILRVFKFWRTEREKSAAAKITPQRGRNILDRLRFGFTAEQIEQAIKGVRHSPHHMGQNDRETVYDDIELICRDDQKTEQFIELFLQIERGKGNAASEGNWTANKAGGPKAGHAGNGAAAATAGVESERSRKLKRSSDAFGWADLHKGSAN